MQKEVIYVAGPYRSPFENGVFENIMHARREARKLWLKGWTVICTHLNSALMGGPDDAGVYLQGGIELLRRSDAIYMLKGWKHSEGATVEWQEAHKLKLKVYYERGAK